MKVNITKAIEKVGKLRWWHIALISLTLSALAGLSSGLPSKKKENCTTLILNKHRGHRRDGYLGLHGR